MRLVFIIDTKPWPNILIMSSFCLEDLGINFTVSFHSKLLCDASDFSAFHIFCSVSALFVVHLCPCL